jgi:pSer/pThr/pTyr-binding forkhead associated (FHA) protein
VTPAALPTPRELQRRLEAERLGRPYLLYRSAADEEVLFAMPAEEGRPVTVGRSEDCDVRLARDPEVSRLHAQLELLGGTWVVVDDGLSRNGTFLNGERVTGRDRLANGDVLRCGESLLTFRDPAGVRYDSTRPASGEETAQLTDSQRRVLVALCRPLREGGTYAMPAGNQEIADELVLSVGAVKGHLRTLFERFGVEDLPQNRKRLRLVERAVETGTVSLRELRDE